MYYPFNLTVLKYAFLLSLSHGFYEFAIAIKNFLIRYNQESIIANFETNLYRAVHKWNLLLESDGTEIYEKYSNSNANVNYRELLYLTKRFAHKSFTPTHLAYLSDYGLTAEKELQKERGSSISYYSYIGLIAFTLVSILVIIQYFSISDF